MNLVHVKPRSRVVWLGDSLSFPDRRVSTTPNSTLTTTQRVGKTILVPPPHIYPKLVSTQSMDQVFTPTQDELKRLTKLNGSFKVSTQPIRETSIATVELKLSSLAFTQSLTNTLDQLLTELDKPLSSIQEHESELDWDRFEKNIVSEISDF